MRIRRIAPWLIAFEVLRAGRAHWDTLDPDDRRHVTDLMRRSHGDPRRLTSSDKTELTALARRLRLGRLAMTMGAAAIMGHRRHRRR